MNKLIRLVAGALMLFPSSSFAAPSVSLVSGALSSGQTITISGSGFGTKTPANPLLWSNFDSGSNGAYISGDSNWPAYISNGGRYSNTSPYGGSGLCAFNDEVNEFGTNYHVFESSYDELYYTYRSRYVGSPTVRIYKNGRINTGGNQYSGDGMIAISDSYVFYRPDNASTYPADRYFTGIGSSTWKRHELYGKVSNPAGTANGRIFATVGDEVKDYANIVSRATGYSFQYNSVILGLMMANTEAGDSHDMYIDDVYIDNTLSRVEICTGSTWENKGDCDPQPPTSWSDNSVQATINVGSKTGTVYLYVVDSTGAGNVNGYQITMGAILGIGGKMSGGGAISSGGYMR